MAVCAMSSMQAVSKSVVMGSTEYCVDEKEMAQMLGKEHRQVSDGVHATLVDISNELELQEQATLSDVYATEYLWRGELVKFSDLFPSAKDAIRKYLAVEGDRAYLAGRVTELNKEIEILKRGRRKTWAE